ncbi:uncharacterized protein LOC100908051 [Galendromus occidentalis]|uniref:Uncharacterized protein LOC100908051 n=1 Tax=Galendromus occidentalis TaxID=34638 RepID=A0AAJ6QZ16_9ACAR|nr:uncharacterized protein LOC100908051 [Galendromus occidentalis]
MEFTNAEKTDMFAAFVANGRNATAALQAYKESFPDRRAPCKSYFGRLEESLRNTGRFDHLARACPNEDLETAILALVFAKPEVSSREVAEQCHTDHSTVLSVFHKHNLRPFKTSKVQHLRLGDRTRRESFCRWLLEEHERCPAFSSKILWSDECNFSNRGFFNRKNTHYWSTEKTGNFKETNNQVRFSFNVWCGLLGSRIVGPFLYNGTLSGADYQRFLQNELVDLLDDFPLQLRREMIFMQDGAPAHNARDTMNILRNMFPGRVLATNGDIKWPARSPDLTPLDFYLWGKVKDEVYHVSNLPYETEEDLKAKVTEVIRNINPGEVRTATRSVLRRCRLCLTQLGCQFEQLL